MTELCKLLLIIILRFDTKFAKLANLRAKTINFRFLSPRVETRGY